jgi:F-type H+-transporting ATPase subunit alpha
MKQVSGTLRLDLAQYREKAAFAQFGSDLDAATQKQLARGARLVEMLKQDQYSPMPVEEQVLMVYAGTKGYTDKVEIKALKEYEKQLLEFMHRKHADVLKDMQKSKIEGALQSKLNGALEEFGASFTV